MKKIVSAITALCMVVSMGATMASAATSTKDETTGKYTIEETFPTAVATGSVAGAEAYPDWTLSGSTARVSTTSGFGNDWNQSGAFAGFYTAKKISGNYTYELVNIKSTAYSETGKTSYIYFNTSTPEQSSTMIGYRLEIYMTSKFEWTVRLQKNNGSGWVYADTSDTEDKITIKHNSTSGRDGIKVNYAISQTVNSDGSLTINCQATYTDTTQPNIEVTDGTLTYTDTAPVAKSGYIGVGNSNAQYESFGSIRVSNADLIDVFAEDFGIKASEHPELDIGTATGGVSGADNIRKAYPNWVINTNTSLVTVAQKCIRTEWNGFDGFSAFYNTQQFGGDYTYNVVEGFWTDALGYFDINRTKYVYFNVSGTAESNALVGYRLKIDKVKPTNDAIPEGTTITVTLQKNDGGGWVDATEDKITARYTACPYAIKLQITQDYDEATGAVAINVIAMTGTATQVSDATIDFEDDSPVSVYGYIGFASAGGRYEGFGDVSVGYNDFDASSIISKTTYSYSSDGWVRGCHKAESLGFSLGDSTITNAWTDGINDKWATYTGRMFADSYSIGLTDKTEYTNSDAYTNITYFNMDKVPTDFNCTGVKGYRLKKSYNNATQISTFTLQRNDGTAGWVDINDATTTLTMDGKGTQVTGLLLELTKSESGLGIKCTVTPESGYTTTDAVVINCTDATPVSTMGYFGVATNSWRGITFSDISVAYKTKGIATPVSTISATEILADAPLTVTFANELGMTPTADNVSVKDAEGNPVTVKVTSGKNSITITPQGMSKKTAYTVIVKDVADAYGNLMGGEWTVNTKASTSIYIDSVTGVSYNEDTKAVSYNATLKNYEATGTAYVIVVAYDSSNRLLGVEIYPNQTITSSEAVTLNTPFTVTKKPATVKCFAWNNFTDIIPYCDAVAVTVE